MSHRGHASTQELLDEDGTDARVVGEGDVRDLRRVRADANTDVPRFERRNAREKSELRW